MNNNDIKNWIINWFIENSDLEEGEIKENLSLNYLESDWIDSLKFIQFIGEVENNFKINFLNDEFQNRDFGTIEGLAKIIKNKIYGEEK